MLKLCFNRLWSTPPPPAPSSQALWSQASFLWWSLLRWCWESPFEFTKLLPKGVVIFGDDQFVLNQDRLLLIHRSIWITDINYNHSDTCHGIPALSGSFGIWFDRGVRHWSLGKDLSFSLVLCWLWPWSFSCPRTSIYELLSLSSGKSLFLELSLIKSAWAICLVPAFSLTLQSISCIILVKRTLPEEFSYVFYRLVCIVPKSMGKRWSPLHRGLSLMARLPWPCVPSVCTIQFNFGPFVFYNIYKWPYWLLHCLWQNHSLCWWYKFPNAP